MAKRKRTKGQTTKCSCHCSTEYIDRLILYTLSNANNVPKLNRQNLLKSHIPWGYWSQWLL